MTTTGRSCGVMGRIVGVLALLSGVAANAEAGFIFTSQTRSVSGSLSGSLGSVGPQTITAPPAPDFSVFDQSVSLTHPTYGGGALAHQRSELLPLVISVTGQTSASRPAMVGTGIASASSNTTVNFDLIETTDITLSASGTAFYNGALTNNRVMLTGPGSTTLVNWSALFGDQTQFPATTGSRSTSLTLPPGSYQFIVCMGSYNDSHASSSLPNFLVAMAIPEPGSALGIVALAFAAAGTRPQRGRHGRAG